MALYTETQLEFLQEEIVLELNTLLMEVEEQYKNEAMVAYTPAQRVALLQERRRIIMNRALVTGVIKSEEIPE